MKEFSADRLQEMLMKGEIVQDYSQIGKIKTQVVKETQRYLKYIGLI